MGMPQRTRQQSGSSTMTALWRFGDAHTNDMFAGQLHSQLTDLSAPTCGSPEGLKLATTPRASKHCAEGFASCLSVLTLHTTTTVHMRQDPCKLWQAVGPFGNCFGRWCSSESPDMTVADKHSCVPLGSSGLRRVSSTSRTCPDRPSRQPKSARA